MRLKKGTMTSEELRAKGDGHFGYGSEDDSAQEAVEMSAKNLKKTPANITEISNDDSV